MEVKKNTNHKWKILNLQNVYDKFAAEDAFPPHSL